MKIGKLALLAFAPLAACGGGSTNMLDTADIGTESIGVAFIGGESGPLSDNIEAAGISFPTPLSLALDETVEIAIASDYGVTISNSAGTLASFGAADQAPSIDGFNQTFFKNGGTDGLIYRKPFTSFDPETFDAGFDYVTFGIWLQGASENIALATGPFEVGDAGVLSVGHITQTATLTSLGGTANYVGDATAILADCLIVEDILTGVVSLQADFAALTVNGTITLDHSDRSRYGIIQTGLATIDAPDATFNSLTASSDQGMTGHVHGFVAGPLGEEIGGQFHLEEDGTERRLIGAFGAFDPNVFN